MTVINLPAIEHALRHLQRAFPQINKDLFDRRDPLDDEVIINMLEGYAAVDCLICDGVDIFAMGHLHYWLELNTIVLCGRDAFGETTPPPARGSDRVSFLRAARRRHPRHHGLVRRQPGQKRLAPRRRRLYPDLSEPQLFIEGNHRAGALIMSYLLAREGRAPFVLTDKNAREFFNPSSVFKKTKKRSVLMRIKMPGLTSAFADYLKHQANETDFLSRRRPPRRRWTTNSGKLTAGQDKD